MSMNIYFNLVDVIENISTILLQVHLICYEFFNMYTSKLTPIVTLMDFIQYGFM